jgi:hypothetical protein
MRLPLPILFLIATAALLPLRAEDEPVTGVMVDLSRHSLQPLPSWLAVTDAEPTGTAFQIAAPQGVSDLAVTFYFRETNGSTLSVDWLGINGAFPLSANLCEGVDLPNQRTLLISRETIGAFGSLVVSSPDGSPLVDRVRFDWTVPSTVASTPGALVPGLLRADGSLLAADELDGQPVFPEEDEWTGRTVTAALSAVPERVERGVAYCVDIAESPKWARLSLQVLGLPLDSAVAIWINGRSAGQLMAETPNLNDPGLITDSEGHPSYAGWRKVTLFVPAGLIMDGENTFQFSRQDPLNAAPALAVKDVTLQLRFHDTPPEPSRLAPPRPTLR